jgi:2-oxoglutarate dehydrogenase complex dehydrogenase (E1) component-like enzyme
VPSTPAQYFHLLRRQMHRDVRKPLIVFTPKSLLRLPAARSRTDEFVTGHFQETVADPIEPEVASVRRVLLASGKIAFDLEAYREKQGIVGVAILRLEQLYPFPHDQILEHLERYPNADELRWVQEEPENMGAYVFIHFQLHSFRLPQGVRFGHVSREESASPATGSATVHEREQQDLLKRAFEGLEAKEPS